MHILLKSVLISIPEIIDRHVPILSFRLMSLFVAG